MATKPGATFFFLGGNSAIFNYWGEFDPVVSNQEIIGAVTPNSKKIYMAFRFKVFSFSVLRAQSVICYSQGTIEN